MGAGFKHGSLSHADNQVGIGDRTEPVGNEQHGGASQRFHEVFTDNAFCLIIERRCGFIHDQHVGALQDGASDSDALALAAGKARAPLPNLGGVASRQIHDEIMGSGNCGCLDDLFCGGVWIGECNVFLNRTVKQHSVLRHNP